MEFGRRGLAKLAAKKYVVELLLDDAEHIDV